ncbi:MAG: glycosyltransferase, partial [Thermoplasmata archaeon]|nr:glycosyltransferase [Thermoplasmata archaeon]
NLSMTSSVTSDVWYIQGRPVGPVLRTIGPSLRSSLRIPVGLLGSAAGLVDEKHIRLVASRSGAIYTNSRFLRSWFEAEGIPVQGTVPQYLFPLDFAPTTSNPRRDYALVYLGKETEFSTVRDLVRTGVPVKVFGGKSEDWIDAESKFDRYPNLEIAGRVSHEELKELYTHALFTAFPFTEEPFGLVPIESMACGTPVLTYAKQGPGETVLDGVTGWLVHNADEFHVVARNIFKGAYPRSWSGAAIERSREFRLDRVAQRWRGMLHDVIAQPSRDSSSVMFDSIGPGARHTPAH